MTIDTTTRAAAALRELANSLTEGQPHAAQINHALSSVPAEYVDENDAERLFYLITR